jgi:hypothetical protein
MFYPLSRLEISAIRSILKPKKRLPSGFALYLQENSDTRPKHMLPQVYMQQLGKEWKALSESEKKWFVGQHNHQLPQTSKITSTTKVVLRLILLQQHAKNLASEHRLYNQLFNPNGKRVKDENWTRILSQMVNLEMTEIRERMPKPPPFSWVQYCVRENQFGGLPEDFDKNVNSCTCTLFIQLKFTVIRVM